MSDPYPVNLEEFWRDDEAAHGDNCFAEAKQVALGIRMSGECVFEELDEPGHPWAPTERGRRMDLNKRYNDKAERIVGRRLLPEHFPAEDAALPEVKRIGEVFGGRYIWSNHSEWLEGSLTTPRELEKRLDFIDKMDMRAFILPPDWEKQKREKFERYGAKPGRCRHVRGPVTLACSVFGIENLIFLIADEPDLARRFSDTIARVIIQIAELFDEEAGGAPEGFSFADDNCCMLNDEMYEFFGYPVLKRVFERFSPAPYIGRYQHSDSAMEHLLPILGKLDFTGVNFGPTVTVDKIRKFMPRTRIDGCIAPYTFMNDDREKLVDEVKRDCEEIKKTGRGLNLGTAGSINNGSSLLNLRAVMWAITQFGRYE